MLIKVLLIFIYSFLFAHLIFTTTTGGQLCRSCKTCDAQSTTPGTCAVGSVSDMICSCNSGYFGDGFVCNPCKTCDDHASKSGTPCSIGSTADTVVCTCEVGYSGDGTECAASSSLQIATIVILVTLPLSITEFRSDESKFIASVASAASVKTSSVDILNVTDVSTRRMYGVTKRMLMGPSVQVKTLISSPTENEIAIQQDVLNVNLHTNGLPSGMLTILSNISSSTPTSSPAPSSKTSTIIGIVLALGAVLLMFGLYLLMRKPPVASCPYPFAIK